MGNSSSAEQIVRARLQQFEKSNNITWSQFLCHIQEMNSTCKTMMEPNGDYLCFALAKDSVENVFWKQHVKVLCFKVNYNSKKIVSCKALNFDEFINAHNLKKSMPVTSLHADPEHNAMTTSTMILAETADQDGVCVICMDSPNQVLLPCLHAFCLVCVSQQNEIRTPFCCPVCRMPIQKPIEDSWEVPDIPKPHEVAEYLSEIANAEKRHH